MASNPRKKKSEIFFLLVIFFVSFGFMSMVQQFIQWQYKRGFIQDVPVIFRSPKLLKGISLNFNEILADIIWIRSVRYIYHHYHVDNQYPHLYDLLNQIVALSPHFIDVYRLGAENLFIVARETDKAIELLEKGIENNPDEWILYYKLGQCYHLGKNDLEKGLYYYTIASRIPGAPPFISREVADLRALTGEELIVYKMWERLYSTTRMKNLRQAAKERMSRKAERADVMI